MINTVLLVIIFYKLDVWQKTWNIIVHWLAIELWFQSIYSEEGAWPALDRPVDPSILFLQIYSASQIDLGRLREVVVWKGGTGIRRASLSLGRLKDFPPEAYSQNFEPAIMLLSYWRMNKSVKINNFLINLLAWDLVYVWCTEVISILKRWLIACLLYAEFQYWFRNPGQSRKCKTVTASSIKYEYAS